MPAGCTSEVYTGNVKLTPLTFAATAKQNVELGYTETLCVQCENGFGSKIQKDGWKIHQKRNCGTAMANQVQTTTPTNKVVNYAATSTMVTQITDSSAFFTNTFATECLGITECFLKSSGGCANAYAGTNIAIEKSTGKITAKTNVDAGYTEIVCVECRNTALSTITFDMFQVRQKPNCNTLTAKVVAPLAYDYSSALTSTTITDNQSIFTNSKPVACPMKTCVILAENCVDAIAAPYASLFSIGTLTPWTLKVSQTKPDGYPNYKVCYKCTTSEKISGETEQSLTNLITIRQKINCEIAMSGGGGSVNNGTSLMQDFTTPAGSHYDGLAYSSSTSAIGLTQYDTSTKFFQNLNGADCGGFTTC